MSHHGGNVGETGVRMWEINEKGCWSEGGSSAGRGHGEPLFPPHKLISRANKFLSKFTL
jgi:hypothetical protein